MPLPVSDTLMHRMTRCGLLDTLETEMGMKSADTMTGVADEPAPPAGMSSFCSSVGGEEDVARGGEPALPPRALLAAATDAVAASLSSTRCKRTSPMVCAEAGPSTPVISGECSAA